MIGRLSFVKAGAGETLGVARASAEGAGGADDADEDIEVSAAGASLFEALEWHPERAVATSSGMKQEVRFTSQL